MDFGGNTRPLSKKLVITLLRRLDVISAEAVEAYMHATMRQCSLRHAQKIAQVLRIIIHAAAKVAEADWPASGEAVDQHTIRSMQLPLTLSSTAYTLPSVLRITSWRSHVVLHPGGLTTLFYLIHPAGCPSAWLRELYKNTVIREMGL